MLVLGLESSCDETAAAVVADGVHVLSDVVASQVEVHAPYGGVVPELASRAHVINIIPTLDAALERAGISLDDIDGVAVTRGPGLVGALLVAVQTGKALAYARGLPLVGVHDKVAKLIGLAYPGGVAIERLAPTGTPHAVVLPRPMTGKHTGDEFSFSGLKTAVLNHVRANGVPQGQALADLCASFQATVVEVLVRKTRSAARRLGLEHVQVCGGVAANSGLRSEMRAAGIEDGFAVYVPSPKRCTDNAAMIAAAGYRQLVRGERAALELNATSSWPLPRAEASA